MILNIVKYKSRKHKKDFNLPEGRLMSMKIRKLIPYQYSFINKIYGDKIYFVNPMSPNLIWGHITLMNLIKESRPNKRSSK